MNIIGHASGYGYIVEISLEEMECITGAYRHPHNRLGTGTKVAVRPAWNAIRATLDSRDAVEKAAKLLRAQADALSSLLQPIVEEQLPAELKAEG